MISRYSLKTQLIAVFIITFLMAAILATFIINRMHALADLNAATYRHPFTVSNAVRDVKNSITSMHRYMKDVALAENKEQMELAITNVNTAEQNVYRNFDLIKIRFLGDQSLVNSAVKSVDDWVVIRNEVIHLMRTDSRMAAAEITKNKGALHVALIEEHVNALLDFANIKASQFSQKSEEMTETILSTTMLILALFFLVGMGVIYSLYHALSKQLTTLGNAAYGISEGNYTTTVPDLGNNEIGVLAKEFEKMRQSIHNSSSEIHAAKGMAEKANASKSKFLTNMSHEFRTPMHGILSFSQLGLSKEEKDDHSKSSKYFEHIIESADRLMHLVNNLFDLSKFGAGKVILRPRKTSLSKIVQQQIDSHAQQLKGKTIQVISKLEAETIATFDPMTIDQVVGNLLTNAIDYSPTGSTITVKCTQNERPGNMLDIASSYKEILPVLYFSIQNEGTGIPDDELNEIFQPFVQSSKTDTEAGGTGLGLAISKEIIDLHGGNIWVESSESTGTIFHFIIPVEHRISEDALANK